MSGCFIELPAVITREFLKEENLQNTAAVSQCDRTERGY